MAKIGTFSKQPTDVLDYDVDYSEWLSASDELIAATVEIDQTAGAAKTLVLNGQEISSRGIKLWLSGGADGDRYVVTVTSTTKEGRVKQDEFTMNIKEI